MIVKDKYHLVDLIWTHIKTNGHNCDLNHLDVSKIKDMSYLFANIQFNGDISKWNVSNVEDMNGMFEGCRFNGDLSQWNTSNVTNMSRMFKNSKFGGDISNWNVSNVVNMNSMFLDAPNNINTKMWNPNKNLEFNWNSAPAQWKTEKDSFWFWLYALEKKKYGPKRSSWLNRHDVEYLNSYKEVIKTMGLNNVEAANFLKQNYFSKNIEGLDNFSF